jgi:hypothetical protein
MRNFFTRHRARRPTIEQERFDLVVCFSDFAAFDHLSQFTIADDAFSDQDVESRCVFGTNRASSAMVTPL